MSVEWFDLAQRLYAAETRSPVARLTHTTFAASTAALAVRAVARGGSVTVSVAGFEGREERARDVDALGLLAAHGGTIVGRCDPAPLLTDDTGTLPALVTLARAHAHHPDPQVAGAAAMVAWWADRADHPGTSAVVNLVAASSARYVLGTTPEAERSATTWRQWLRICDDGVSGLHEWAAKISGGPLLPLLEPIHEDDRYSWDRALSAATAGHDWSRPDNTASAAMGLRTRCDAAELKSAALLDDPLWRQRAVHTGHVAVGVASVTPPPKGSRRRNASLSVTCDRLDSRLRVGSEVTGWMGTPADKPFERFFVEVTSAQVVEGKLVLGLGSVGAHAPAPGARVCLMPGPPSPQTMRAGRGRYWRLYRARRSWLSTGQTPVAARREVPLDVLIAGAED
ncbi:MULTISPECIES: hypothetical protein [Rhodococcus]|uniref:Uncharacterized protein n=2 Tax=Rhodococcus opacus TaxID=37919 RepID=C1BC18_RHOOB|nr:MULTISPECIES: hypothetical protein [Rhodococcus]EID75413.1 hypothetical protein W59_27616 [Rhodococcus opacus RKJ300 = JCM 13270]QQZ18627.1 hypothetical protein GO592_41605 [Rhodococcus sp. 21391]UOT07897.1 hypothetical protein MPY17_36430 [Rhodococcus opacus]BAH55600.1 hypothetical protein ROP_pROB01-01010 [Rhodococcus opacus B4]